MFIEVKINGLDKKTTKDFIKFVSPNCCGKQTLRIYNIDIQYVNIKTGEITKETNGSMLYHYGVPIMIYDRQLKNCIMNKRYYDYSTSTSNARNRFIEFVIGTYLYPNTKELRKAEKQNLCIAQSICKYYIRPAFYKDQYKFFRDTVNCDLDYIIIDRCNENYKYFNKEDNEIK